MSNIYIAFRGKPLRQFVSYRHLFAFLTDFTLKALFITLFILAPISQVFLPDIDFELGRYVFLYIAGVALWGFLVIRFILASKRTFGKTYFDLYFMGILSISLLSVLLSDKKVNGVFGVSEMWAISVLTFLTVSVIYFVAVLSFKYLKGVKWLALGSLSSLFVPSLYTVTRILADRNTPPTDFVVYAIYAIPLVIAFSFLFKKIYLRIFAFLSFLLVLFLISFYMQLLEGVMFVLGTSVLSLFLLFYFSFWIKSNNIILKFLRSFISSLKKKSIIAFLKKERRGEVVLLLMLLTAFWIIAFGHSLLSYFRSNISPFLSTNFHSDFDTITGLKTWLIGRGDLSGTRSSFEILNVLANYGIFAVSLFIAFFVHMIVKSARFTLRFLYASSWRNIVLAASLFVTSVSLLITFLLTRFSPLVYLLLVFVAGNIAIINDLLAKRDLYSLPSLRAFPNTRTKAIKGIAVVIVLALIYLIVRGILNGAANDVFSGV